MAGFGFDLDVNGQEILDLLGKAVPVALKEMASVIADKARDRTTPHTRTGETWQGISAGTIGRKVVVQTAWPGIAIDRPHRLLTGTRTSMKQKSAKTARGRMYRGGDRVVPGLFYVEEGFQDASPDFERILSDQTDTAARKQEFRLQRFTKNTSE
jgi:hypothetical protein